MANKLKKRRDLRILWNANGSFTNSGYGVETRDLLYRFLKDGWPVAQTCNWGLEGYPITIDGLKHYPKMNDPWGSDAMYYHALDFKANAVFAMHDVWTFDPQWLSKINTWIPYCPIDKDPVPQGVLDRLRYAYKIITFSKFGQRTLEKAGFASTLIVEGTDTAIFKPMDRKTVRAEMGLNPDWFIFGMIAANKENPPRKGFQEAMEAFKMFAANHPEARILFHTQQNAPTGFPIKAFAEHLGIAEKVFFVDDYKAIYGSESKDVAKEMNALDALLHPSRTEGFGLTVVEAQSCGIPVIVNNTTSMPELVVEGVTGEICDAGWKWFNSDGAWTESPDVNSLHEKMETLYQRIKEDREGISKACRDHVLQNYNIDSIVKRDWIPFLEELQREVLPEESK